MVCHFWLMCHNVWDDCHQTKEHLNGADWVPRWKSRSPLQIKLVMVPSMLFFSKSFPQLQFLCFNVLSGLLQKAYFVLFNFFLNIPIIHWVNHCSTLCVPQLSYSTKSVYFISVALISFEWHRPLDKFKLTVWSKQILFLL